jgi:hypothetical protein
MMIDCDVPHGLLEFADQLIIGHKGVRATEIEVHQLALSFCLDQRTNNGGLATTLYERVGPEV